MYDFHLMFMVYVFLFYVLFSSTYPCECTYLPHPNNHSVSDYVGISDFKLNSIRDLSRGRCEELSEVMICKIMICLFMLHFEA